jgi:hypothetical protein
MGFLARVYQPEVSHFFVDRQPTGIDHHRKQSIGVSKKLVKTTTYKKSAIR